MYFMTMHPILNNMITQELPEILHVAICVSYIYAKWFHRTMLLAEAREEQYAFPGM